MDRGSSQPVLIDQRRLNADLQDLQDLQIPTDALVHFGGGWLDGDCSNGWCFFSGPGQPEGGPAGVLDGLRQKTRRKLSCQVSQTQTTAGKTRKL